MVRDIGLQLDDKMISHVEKMNLNETVKESF